MILAGVALTQALYALTAVAYLGLAGFVALRAPPGRTRLVLVAASVLTAAWAGTVAWDWEYPLSGAAGLLDLVRSAGWYGVALHLYHRTIPLDPARGELRRNFAMVGGLIVLMIAATAFLGGAGVGGAVSILSVGIAARIGLSVCTLLLLENLYLNTPADARWNVNLLCVALGGLAVYDLVLCTDAVLFRAISVVLVDGRAIAAVLVTPLLAIAALRNRRWEGALAVSRTAVFHSASLVGSGLFLLALAAMGEVFRRLGPQWGAVAEVGLISGGVIAIAVMLTSGSFRSKFRRLVVDHFFKERFDYRREWLRCIATLSGEDSGAPLHARVIRAVAQVVDSPAGILFLREPDGSAFQWAGSWNMPAVSVPVPPDHPLLPVLAGGEEVVELHPAQLAAPATAELGDSWLAVPLLHGGGLSGFVLVAQPRAPFRLDGEVFALLRTIGQEVATYLAEQRATQVLMETRELRDFGKRFAFVAHDIKNVSAQLSLMLANAEHHLDNPEFQQDMLQTVRASVAKIGALIKRLSAPEGQQVGPRRGLIAPLERLGALAGGLRRSQGAAITVEHDGLAGEVAMDPGAFDAVITHLLNNAVEASDGHAPIRISLRHEGRRMVIDVADQGVGMTPEFVRDELFRPFGTSKREGSGIGAFQARELLREAGGDLVVTSRKGEGTTMRLLLPLAQQSQAAAAPPQDTAADAAAARVA